MAKAAVALSVLVLLAACESPKVATPSPTPSAAGAIPWTPLAPHLTPPGPTLGPAPLPPGTPPCQSTDLVGTVTGSNGATGHVITSFGFAGAGAVCYLDGTPSVGLLDSIGISISFRQQAPYMPPLHPGRALIEPGPAPAPRAELLVGQASLTIDWISQPEFCPGTTSGVLPAKAVIAIPSGGILTLDIPPEPAAYPCAGLGVGIFEGPYVPIQQSPPPPLPAISMQVPSSARVGHALPYLVTLTNDRGQALDLVALCPTYEEELFADIVNGSPPLGGKHIYALNCGPVGTLAAGASVTFQMVFLQVPPDAAAGMYTLVFMLGYWNAMTSYTQASVTIGT